MTKEDEKELHRLAEMLRLIDGQLPPASPLREGLEKAGLALSLTFLHGLRSELEGLHDNLGRPLTDDDWRQLRMMGINPDEPA